MNRRHCAAAAITLVCALAVLTVPTQAFAAPAPPSPSHSPTAPAGPQRKSLEEVREEIDALYRKAGAATDAYNLAEEQAKKQSGEIVKLAQAIVEGQAKIADLKSRAGAQAREQYRTGGLPPGAQMMLSDDPRLFMDGVNRVWQGQQAAKGVLGELTRTQEDLEAYTKDASSNWKKLEANRLKQAKAKKRINGQIAAAKKLESQLEKKERARLLELEQEAEYKAQTAWLGSGALKEINREASAGGKKAVAFATAQIGKPYVWGAEGPGSYDCSGLTSQAWAAAGRPIPRTSQEQWRQLPHIAVKDMRPGDLIIYHGDASHVGMYIGDGAIVHAPRPGRNVTLAGAGSMEILGVVRPDR
ncbi:NlpC/P60 family protein [Streptomyces sp. NBC_01724]|uniref:C40 family peptidase n=1 Tax=unclassified Streptomyces TaxID=2593676 RepID=UPI0028C39747|nr:MULTISPECIES: NlpC/P60 family protein [unclassified Streptomyces]WNO66214.1 NlpC/P60 family protein [Streptomyces sp. AM2-3-1]WSC70748.1 NlpC/P60 family protein [Streptomyces sp. NBC_01760]WTE61226.1 NlpC/P60 family protein [Streptomyces sp. NBC_01617]WTI88640.1 NlpC/P60 family protein [Streptomyces sp. NBC_00724]